VNREVHARIWERPGVRFLRATRPPINNHEWDGGDTINNCAPMNVRKWPCVTSIAGPYGDTQLYER